MADIELVIKLEEETYNRIMNGRLQLIELVNLMENVQKGTPIPKGHGRLIDADTLYDNTKLCHTEEDGTACVEWREINDAPTIIERDERIDNNETR